MISVVIPTIDGREDLLARCVASYERTLPLGYEIITLKNRPNCGQAWGEGLEKAQGDYVHLTADDIEAHRGWWAAAQAWVALGCCPCPRILNTDGTLQSCGAWETEQADGSPTVFTRVPFVHKDWVKYLLPMLDAHYYTDVWLSEVLRRRNIDTVVSTRYLLTHHRANVGRLDSDAADKAAYEAGVAAL